jgi:hypothetical protein
MVDCSPVQLCLAHYYLPQREKLPLLARSSHSGTSDKENNTAIKKGKDYERQDY